MVRSGRAARPSSTAIRTSRPTPVWSIVSNGDTAMTPRSVYSAKNALSTSSREKPQVVWVRSFVPNDLTQTTWGFSRDDVESAFFAEYTDLGVIAVSPFETIDQTGVGRLVRIAVEEGRAARPDLTIGVCGEHGGDPESVHFFDEVGLDYVSCSPFRVPIARLEAGSMITVRARRTSSRTRRGRTQTSGAHALGTISATPLPRASSLATTACSRTC